MKRELWDHAVKLINEGKRFHIESKEYAVASYIFADEGYIVKVIQDGCLYPLARVEFKDNGATITFWENNFTNSNDICLEMMEAIMRDGYYALDDSIFTNIIRKADTWNMEELL